MCGTHTLCALQRHLACTAANTTSNSGALPTTCMVAATRAWLSMGAMAPLIPR